MLGWQMFWPQVKSSLLRLRGYVWIYDYVFASNSCVESLAAPGWAE